MDGEGGMALNATAIDTRIRAIVTSTMYDMSRVTANGYFDSMSVDDRYKIRENLNTQRTKDYKNDSYVKAGGLPTPEQLSADAPQFLKDYVQFYKTDRGYHVRSVNSNAGWNATYALSFANMPILQDTDEIRNAVLMIHGEKVHSVYFSQDAYKRLTGDNKELMIIPGAVHKDLYDQLNIIPFDKINDFFNKYLS